MTRPKLYPEPEGLDPTVVECPQCGASLGWACGPDHVSGSHRKRIKAAQFRKKDQREQTFAEMFKGGELTMRLTVTGIPADECEALADKNPELVAEILANVPADTTFTEGFLEKYPNIAKLLKDIAKLLKEKTP